ncbi:24950_t:CDS:2, partial [Dentiscutata erythropus]
LLEEIVEILKPFEKITRHVCGAKYPTMNLVYPPLSDSEEIADSDTSVSSDDKADIPSAGSRKQWQYAHAYRSVYHREHGYNRVKKYKKKCVNRIEELDDSDIIRYLPSTNCDGLLERIDTERTQTTIEEDCDSLSAEL